VDWSGVEWSGVEGSGVERSGVERSAVEWSGVEWRSGGSGVQCSEVLMLLCPRFEYPDDYFYIGKKGL